MYSQKFAIAIKNNGTPLREINEKVYLPFGSEYSILLKNLNTVRAAATVEIDGKNVTEGLQLVVEPNSSFEIERYIRNENLNQGNRFKFIERSSKIEQARGIGIDDGLVRVTFQFEKPVTQYTTRTNWLVKGDFDDDNWGNLGNYQNTGWKGHPGITVSNTLGNVNNSRRISYSKNGVKMKSSKAGITAPGSISNQNFSVVSGINLELTVYVMILKLLGSNDEKYVTKPLTTKTRRTCITCRHSNNPGNKFCQECGTSLVIL